VPESEDESYNPYRRRFMVTSCSSDNWGRDRDNYPENEFPSQTLNTNHNCRSSPRGLALDIDDNDGDHDKNHRHAPANDQKKDIGTQTRYTEL
jgi:hypothetical protein